MQYMSVENLKQYHNLLMSHIKSLIELYKNGQTNCPNCGAPIISEECPYCGTNFVTWFEVKE